MYTPRAKQIIKGSFTFCAILILSISTSLANNKSFDLSVKFIRFEATQMDDMVYLRWLTNSEFNNEFFTVERSVDGSTWQALDDVEAIGITPGEGTYGFYDTDPIAGESLYRIKQTDFDGNFSYSFEEPMNFASFVSEDEQAFEVYPNPVQTDIFTLSSKFDLSDVTVKMIDIAGKEVGIKVDVNDTEMSIKAENPIPGLYFLLLQVGPKSIAKKIKFE